MGQLVFKKVFWFGDGIDERMIWLMEIGRTAFHIAPRDDSKKRSAFTIGSGMLGQTNREKTLLQRFNCFLGPACCLKCTTDIEEEIPDNINETVLCSANEYVERYIGEAFVALQNFIEAYRDAKYLTSRHSDRWHESYGVIVQEVSLKQFRSPLFYSLSSSTREFLGYFSDTLGTDLLPEDPVLSHLVQKNLEDSVPLARILMVRAYEALADGNFRSAIVDSAAVIETCISQILAKKLQDNGVEKKSSLDSFIEKTSKRILLEIIGGLFNLETEQWRGEVVATIEVRHALIHGRKRYAKIQEAESAVRHAERLLQLAEQSNAAPSIALRQRSN